MNPPYAILSNEMARPMDRLVKSVTTQTQPDIPTKSCAVIDHLARADGVRHRLKSVGFYPDVL
jgi:hypothetical protein